jgi:ParB/RepB/Spo0J family partition protein
MTNPTQGAAPMASTATPTKTPAAKPAGKLPAKRAPMKRGGKASLGTPPAAAGELALSDIDPSHWPNPRGDIDTTTDAFAEFVATIKAQGVLQPIIVGPALVAGGKHPLIAGWRRYAGAKAAGLKTIPVHQVAITDSRWRLLAAATENVGREPMSPLAEAQVLHDLMTQHKYKQVDAGKAIGMSERTARERLRLLKIAEAAPAAGEAIAKGEIPMDAAVQLQNVAEVAPALAAEIVSRVSAGLVDASELTKGDGVVDAIAAMTTRSGDYAEDQRLFARGVCAVDVSAQWSTLTGEELPLSDEQLERWKAVPPKESYQAGPPAFRLYGEIEGARAAGCLLTVKATDRWGREDESLYITDVEFLKPRLETHLAAMEADGVKRLAAAAKDKAAAAAATGKASAAGLSAAQKAEATKVRDKAARDKETAHHQNVILGERLAHGLDGAAGSVQAAQVLALIALDDAGGSVVASGARYCDPRHLTEETKKNGSVKRTYVADAGKVVNELRDEILAATTVAAAMAPVLRVLALARHADDQVVAPSNRGWFRMRGDNYGDDTAKAAPKLLDELVKDAGILTDLKPEAKRRAAAKPDAAAPTGDVAGPPAAAPAKRVPSARSGKVLELVTAEPGLTIPELAERLGIAQNYLYRILPELQKDGKVTKQDGRKWHPVAA